MQQQVVILGSTGSVGCNTLNVIREHLDKYTIFALSANNQVDKLFEQCVEFKPQYAVLPNPSLAKVLQEKLVRHSLTTKVLAEVNDLSALVQFPEVDIVMSAIVGSTGLLPTLNAVIAGKKVLLANKESLIVGGKLIIEAAKKSKSTIIPVDSEHSAIFQCLSAGYETEPNLIKRIILTASGGPFRNFSQEELCGVNAAQAIKHPNWSMGKKISVDSSTLMNKGLEVIEAYWLFGTGLDKIDVVVHPQSIIHSMVEYIDNSIIAQLGTPDMKTPIAYALAYPKRITSGSPQLDFATLSNLTFEKPDYTRFPCLNLAFTALKVGGIAPAVLNAANEIAVAAFLMDKIKFYDINRIIASTMEHFGSKNFNSVEEIIEVDKEARSYAQEL